VPNIKMQKTGANGAFLAEISSASDPERWADSQPGGINSAVHRTASIYTYSAEPYNNKECEAQVDGLSVCSQQ